MQLAEALPRETARTRRPVQSTCRALAFVPLTLAGLLVAPAGANAQSGGEGFLFREPVLTVSVRGGYALARAGSDIFDFVTSQLTLDKSDFSGVAFGGGLGIRVTSQLDLSVELNYMRAGDRSRVAGGYWEFIGQDSFPVQQITTLTRLPITASLRYYLVPRGRKIGNFAWVPSKWSPFVGVGAGAMRYEFTQSGDFIDFNDQVGPDEFGIFTAVLESAEWIPTAHVFGGAEWMVSRRAALIGEIRYILGSAELDLDFADFDPIDLSGMQATVGMSFRY
jgi:hypothetical protein